MSQQNLIRRSADARIFCGCATFAYVLVCLPICFSSVAHKPRLLSAVSMSLDWQKWLLICIILRPHFKLFKRQNNSILYCLKSGSKFMSYVSIFTISFKVTVHLTKIYLDNIFVRNDVKNMCSELSNFEITPDFSTNILARENLIYYSSLSRQIANLWKL